MLLRRSSNVRVARESLRVTAVPPSFWHGSGASAQQPGLDPRIKRRAQPWLEQSESVWPFGVSRYSLASWSVAVRYRASALLVTPGHPFPGSRLTATVTATTATNG